MLPATERYLREHPEKTPVDPGDIAARIDRLNKSVMSLPEILHRDFFEVLKMSKSQYESSRVIVWTSALMVIGMLCGLAALFHRWVLYPVRLLQRGVRRVARGSFDYHIDLTTGDEMQALAEAFNDMTTRLERHLCRPGAAGPGAEPPARPLRAARGRRLPRGGRCPRDQQPAGLDRVLLRGARQPPDGPARRQRLGRREGRRQLSPDDPGGGVPVQADHREAPRLLPLRRDPARADRPGLAHPERRRDGPATWASTAASTSPSIPAKP